jgi:hypothetical protein
MKSEKTNTGRATICIMADFGNGPYAWLRNPDSAFHVGPNIADVISGFPSEYQISKELEKEFAEWVIIFENNYDKDDFNWPSWEDKGISLTRKLKHEVGNAFIVEYHYPYEDSVAPDPPPIIVID